MLTILLRVLIVTMFLLACLGCSNDVTPPEFDGNRAFVFLEEQVAFGPRVPGTEAWAECRSYFYQYFSGLGLEVDSQAFTFNDPYTGVDTPLVNVIVAYRGDPSDDKAALLLAHWDSRPRTDYHSDSSLRETEPIDGANDGASGVAVLMELGRLIAEHPPNSNVVMVLADGEDWGRVGDNEYYSIGSRNFARQGIRGKYHFGIVIDMVGDRNQHFFREETSERFSKPVNDMIWETARDLGITSFRDTVLHRVTDDHVPLNVGGVPTVDVIDFNYPYWHTEFDTPDKCSPESLANVGKVLTEIIYRPSLWPKK
jgi:Zn-dependent M28 family amino/carboxypeptidase